VNSNRDLNPGSRDDTWGWNACVLLFFAVLAAYATAIPGEFVWLDHREIEQAGYRIESSRDVWQMIVSPLDDYLERNEGGHRSHGGYWRPLYGFSQSLDWRMWGEFAPAYHVENLVWHLLVVLGLYALGRRALAWYGIGSEPAFWSALLFAVHPLGVHSVTWISGRKDVLCAAFAVPALLAFQRYAETPRSVRQGESTGRGGWRNISCLLLLLAIAAKELALVLPAIATMWWICESRAPSDTQDEDERPSRLAGLIALWLTSAAVVAYRIGVLGGMGLGAEYPTPSVLGTVGTSARLWWHYIGRVLVPWEPALSDRWGISTTLGPVELAAVAGIVLVAVGLVLLTLRRNACSAGLWWYVVWMLPASGLVPLRHVRAERYLYPASWGLLLAAITALYLVAARRSVASWQAARWGLGGVAVALAVGTGYENLHWWDDATLFAHAVRQDPEYVEGRLALAHRAMLNEDYELAIEESQRALHSAADPAFVSYWSPVVAHSNLGLAYLRLGRHGEALKEFTLANQARPNNADTHVHLGLAAMGLGNYVAAKQHFIRSLELNPNNFESRSNLASTLLHLGEAQASVALLGPLVEERPEDLINLENYALALFRSGRYRDAAIRYEVILNQHPRDGRVWALHAQACWTDGDNAAAQTSIEEALRWAPDDVEVQQLRDLIQSTNAAPMP